MISVDYFVEIKLYFPSSWTFDETITIPIDFLARPDERQIDNDNNNIEQNIPYYNNSVNKINIGQNIPYYHNNVNNNIGQNNPYNYINSNNNYYPNIYNMNEDIKNHQLNIQEVAPFQNNNNENLTIGGNSNDNFNSQEQNQNFNINEGENTAPPPALNYNNNNI